MIEIDGLEGKFFQKVWNKIYNGLNTGTSWLNSIQGPSYRDPEFHGHSDPTNLGGDPFNQGIKILNAVITIETGGLGFATGTAINSIAGISSVAYMAVAVDEVGTNSKGETISQRLVTDTKVKSAIRIVETAISAGDALVNLGSVPSLISNNKEVFLPLTLAINDISAGILPSFLQTDDANTTYTNTTNKDKQPDVDQIIPDWFND